MAVEKEKKEERGDGWLMWANRFALNKASVLPDAPGSLGVGRARRLCFLRKPAKSEIVGACLGRFLSDGAQKMLLGGFLESLVETLLYAPGGN